MAFITPTAEVVEVGGGVFRNTIHLAPVAYEDASGNLRAISDRWGDGDGTYPHVISAARLRVRTAPNGDRLLLPVPGDDEAWFSISSPFINNGTNWIQPSLGSFSRSGNQLTATAANVITRINHAGHYVKAEYELLNGWTPNNGQFAYRVGLQGLTRQGGTLLYNGVPVMQLRKPVAYDADNPDDIREIAHEFVQLAGNTYILFALPSLAGMSRPVVDPTFTAQPDATAGDDVAVRTDGPTTNYGTNTRLLTGSTSGSTVANALLRFDVSSLSGNTVTSVTFSGWTDRVAGGNFNLGAYSVLPANSGWTEAGATWNTKDGANAWAGDSGADGGSDAGCSVSGTDHNATALGTAAIASSTAANTEVQITLNASQVQSWVDGSNYGMVIKRTDSDVNVIAFWSSDHTTASQRPKLVIEYTTGPAIPVVMHHRRTQGMS